MKKPKTLTGKQLRFVHEYLVDYNATKAAIRAGYSEKTAYSIGFENLRKPEIRAAIEQAEEEQAKRLKINADKVLNLLVRDIQADMNDLLNTNGSFKPVSEWPMAWRQGLVAGIEVAEIWDGKGKDRVQIGETVKVKFSDRLKRLEAIGKHRGVRAFDPKAEEATTTPLDDLYAEIAGTGHRPAAKP